jgi:hypothetical protein
MAAKADERLENMRVAAGEGRPDSMDGAVGWMLALLADGHSVSRYVTSLLARAETLHKGEQAPPRGRPLRFSLCRTAARAGKPQGVYFSSGGQARLLKNTPRRAHVAAAD